MVIETTHELEDLNEDLRKREFELSQVNSSKDKFISIIAHDIKNPLHSISLTAEFLLLYSKKY